MLIVAEAAGLRAYLRGAKQEPSHESDFTDGDIRRARRNRLPPRDRRPPSSMGGRRSSALPRRRPAAGGGQASASDRKSPIAIAIRAVRIGISEAKRG